jgi:hypothetical protein
MSEFSETFENTCRELSDLVNSDRQTTHGDFETFLMTYTDMLRAYIGNVVVRQQREWIPEDTAAILALMKVARCANGIPIPAHTLDMAGYGIAAAAFSMAFRRVPEPQETPEDIAASGQGPAEPSPPAEPAAAPGDTLDAQMAKRAARRPAPAPEPDFEEHPVRPCTCEAGGMFDNCRCPTEGPQEAQGSPVTPPQVYRVPENELIPDGLPDGTVIEVPDPNGLRTTVMHPAWQRIGEMKHGMFVLDTAEVERRAKLS